MTVNRDDNSGALFRNNNRTTDKHPHAKGEAIIDGVEYWISAWTNTSGKGEQYQKLKFNRKDENANKQTANSNKQVKPQNQNFENSFNDFNPF